jgi:hydroxymethylpyrimidine/phosphomethylpyrimidine kinase
MQGRVLVVAGSDSGGGAGIQADIKAIMAMGGFAMTAITAVTAQDTLGVHGVHPIPPDFLRLQMECVLRDIGADAVKTGMLDSAAAIDALCDVLEAEGAGLPVVVDPVMVAKGGQSLSSDAAIVQLKRRLLPLATLLTPNLPEAEALSGLSITDEAGMRRAAETLLTLGMPAVLLKGGHLPGDEVIDILATDDGVETFHAPRIATRHTHGTGCTLASAIAAGLAQGMKLRDAVLRARAYVRAAIAAAPGFGGGHGPMGHGVTVDPARIAALRR